MSIYQVHDWSPMSLGNLLDLAKHGNKLLTACLVSHLNMTKWTFTSPEVELNWWFGLNVVIRRELNLNNWRRFDLDHKIKKSHLVLDFLLWKLASDVKGAWEAGSNGQAEPARVSWTCRRRESSQWQVDVQLLLVISVKLSFCKPLWTVPFTFYSKASVRKRVSQV